jgi:hypothetical protein
VGVQVPLRAPLHGAAARYSLALVEALFEHQRIPQNKRLTGHEATDEKHSATDAADFGSHRNTSLRYIQLKLLILGKTPERARLAQLLHIFKSIGDGLREA